ncbi:MAG: PLD nuclease N-terminal domain-containing protein [Candidatus Acetothermia bacterium]
MAFAEAKDVLLLLIPLLAIQLGLQAFCLLDIWKFNRRKRDRQDRWVWTIVVLVFSLLGPLFYLVFERK